MKSSTEQGKKTPSFNMKIYKDAHNVTFQ